MIVDVFLHYHPGWPIRGGGAWRRLRCPYHDDKHPSASISDEYDVFKCMACDMVLTIRKLIMLEENVDRDRADEIAAAILGESGTPIRGRNSRSRRLPGSPGNNTASRGSGQTWIRVKSSRKTP
ncbi:MAG: hypothetical protein IRZ06_12670 [Nevskia sp.]|nr:hypothetical protein [Nevskia sp.]